jgi:hypothetical protein
MPRPIRPLAVLLAIAALAAGLTACGGGAGEKSSGDAGALIKDTFGAGHPIRSGRVDATLDVDLNGLARLNRPLALHLSGPFQSNGGKTLPDFALELDLDSGAQPITIGATFADGGGYLTIEGQAFDLGDQVYQSFKQGYEKAKADSTASSSAAPSLSALGISPLRWLRDPQQKGREDIAGTQTEHVAAGVDVRKLLEDVSTLLGRARDVTQAGGAATGTTVPTQLTAQQRDAIARSIKSASIDVWTGVKDHTLRKVALDVAVAVPEDLRARAGGLRDGRIRFQATIAQLNERQTIATPADVRPISELRAALQQLGLLGSSTGSGSGSASGSASGSGSASSTTPTGPQAAYAQCLGAAGQDLVKVQKCADLLK